MKASDLDVCVCLCVGVLQTGWCTFFVLWMNGMASECLIVWFRPVKTKKQIDFGPAESVACSSCRFAGECPGSVERCEGEWQVCWSSEEMRRFKVMGNHDYHQLSSPQLGSGQLSTWAGADQLCDTDGQLWCCGHDGQLCCGHGSGLAFKVILCCQKKKRSKIELVTDNRLKVMFIRGGSTYGIGNGNGSGSGNGIIRKRFFCNSKAMAAAFFSAITPWRWAVL